MPFWGSPFRGIFCGVGIMERQRGTQEEGFRCVWIDSDILLSVIVHGPFIPPHSSSRFIHNRSPVSFTRGCRRDFCDSVCVVKAHVRMCISHILCTLFCLHSRIMGMNFWTRWRWKAWLERNWKLDRSVCLSYLILSYLHVHRYSSNKPIWASCTAAALAWMSDLSGLCEMGEGPVLGGRGLRDKSFTAALFHHAEPQQDHLREYSIYRSVTSACALCVRGTWLLMPSRI